MRRRLLILALIVSILLNVAGSVFLVLYLKTLAHLKAVKNERSLLVLNLNALADADSKRDTNAVRNRAQTFISHFDGAQDTFAVAPAVVPPGRVGYTLVVYFHGMGHSYNEPFTTPAEHPIAYAVTADPSLIFLSCNYRRLAAWASDAALADVTQNIREVCQQYPIKNIVLMGCSMGGCVSLIYSALAPADVKSKLLGVVSIEGAGDLASLYSRSAEKSVQGTLTSTFGGSPTQVPEQYAAKSFIKNIRSVPAKLRIAVISAGDDKVVPAALQADIVDACRKNGLQSKLITIAGGHHIPRIDDFMGALKYVMAD